MGLQIRLLGRPAILNHDGAPRTVRGHQTWALLARILLSKHELGRRQLASELFPDTVDPLGSVRWCLASLRAALGSADALGSDPIRSNLPPGTEIDVMRLRTGELDPEATGTLLDGVDPRCSPEFATWLLVERERIAGEIDASIRKSAMHAMLVGSHERAIRLAELGVRRCPFEESAHVLLVKGLVLAGSHAAALDHVQATERAFHTELGVKPSPALRSAARRTVCSPPPGLSSQAVARSQLEAGLAALAAGAVDAGIDCLRHALANAEQCGDNHLHAQALLELGAALVHAIRGHDDEGTILLRQSVEQSQRCSDAKVAAAAYRELGYVDALAGRRPDAAANLAEALQVAADPDSLAGIHAVIGFNLVDWGNANEGLNHYSLSLDYARQARNRRREAWSLGIGSWGQLAAGRVDVAGRWLTDCLAIVRDLRWLAFRPWPVALLAETRLRLNDEPTALRADLQEAFALSCQLADPCWEGISARTLALTYAASGDFASASHWIALARQNCVREPDTYIGLLAAILRNQVEVCLNSGNAAQAASIARELLAVAARAHMDDHVQWAVQIIGTKPGGGAGVPQL
jgi:DNA-binding SARP family transcriptional activator